MYSVGLDVHQRRSSLEILDPNGKRVNRLEVRGPWPKLIEQVGRLPRPFSICFEASCGYGHLYEQLARHAEHVAVAHPAQLRLIFRSKRKSDRVDAAKLAKLLYLGEVPQVHVPDKDVRQWRASIEWRQALLGRRVRAKNQLRAMLRTHGLAASAPKSLWSKKGLAWLAEQPLEEFEQLRREMLLDELAEVNRKLALVERHLAKVAARHPGVALLRTIPGVGGSAPPRRSSPTSTTCAASPAWGRSGRTSGWCRARTAPPTCGGWGTSPRTARPPCASCCARRRGRRCDAARACGPASSGSPAASPTGARSRWWRSRTTCAARWRRCSAAARAGRNVRNHEHADHERIYVAGGRSRAGRDQPPDLGRAHGRPYACRLAE